MPQITLEYTRHLADADWTPVALEIHQAAVEIAGAALSACKTRLIALDHVVIAEVGEAHQSCPILILDGELDWPEAQVSETTGRRFLQDHAIAPYLAARYGVGRPHP